MNSPKSTLSVWSCRCGKYPEISVQFDETGFYIKVECCEVKFLVNEKCSLHELVHKWNGKQLNGKVPF